jgi:hypothetical protein
MMMEVDSLLPEVGLELFKTVCLRERYINRLQSQLQQRNEKQMQLLIKEKLDRHKQNAKRFSSNDASGRDAEKQSAKNSTTISSDQNTLNISGPVHFPIDLSIIGTVDLLRDTTIDVTELLITWEKAQVSYPHSIRPFFWNQQVYTEKMVHDCDFLAEYPSFVAWLGFSPLENPFLVPSEIYYERKSLFFLSGNNTSGKDNVIGETNSYVIFGTKPIVAASKQTKKITQKFSKSPYETPIINDPEVFAHLSVKNQLNEKFQQLSSGGTNTGKKNSGATSEECAELYQCYLSHEQVVKVRNGWNTIWQINARISGTTIRDTGSGIVERDESEKGIEINHLDSLSVEHVQQQQQQQQHQNTVSFLDAPNFETNRAQLDESQENMDGIADNRNPVLLPQEGSVEIGKIGEIGFFSQSQLLPSVFDNRDTDITIDRSVLTINAEESELNVNSLLEQSQQHRQQQMQQQQPGQFQKTADTVVVKSEAERNWSEKNSQSQIGISAENWQYQSPEHYSYLDTLNASQRLKPLSDSHVHDDESLPKIAESAILPNADSLFVNSRHHTNSTMLINTHSQISASQIWTPHELNLQRQVQRRGGELFVLTAAGNTGTMKAPRRSDRYMRLYVDWQMICVLQEKYAMLKEDVLSMMMQTNTNTETVHNDEFAMQLKAAQLSKIQEYNHILKDLSLRQWYLKEQIRQLARVLAHKADSTVKESPTKASKRGKNRVRFVSGVEGQSNTSDSTRIRQQIHESDEFHELFSRFVQFQQDFKRQRQLVKLQDGQARLEDQQRALQVEDAAATRLQTFVRRFFGRKMRQQLLLKYHKSATFLQSAYRRHKMKFMLSDRGQMKRLAEMLKKLYFYRKARALRDSLYLEKLLLSSTMIIQRCFRGYLGRRRLNLKRSWLNSIAAARQSVTGTQHYSNLKNAPGSLQETRFSSNESTSNSNGRMKLNGGIGSIMSSGEGCDGLTPGILEALCDSIEDFLRDVPSGDDIPDFASMVANLSAVNRDSGSEVVADKEAQQNSAYAHVGSSTLPMPTSTSPKLPFTLLLVLRSILFILNGNDSEQLTVTNDDGIAEQRFVYAASATWSQVKLVFRRKGRLLRRLRALIRFVSTPNPGKITLTESTLAHLQLLFSVKERIVYELMAMNFTYHFSHNARAGAASVSSQKEGTLFDAGGVADFQHNVTVLEHPAYRAGVHLLSYSLNLYRIYHYQHLFPEYFEPSLPAWFRSLMILKQDFDKKEYDRRINQQAQKRLLEMKTLHTRLGKTFHHIAEALRENAKILGASKEALQKSKDIFLKKISLLQNEEEKKILTCEAIVRARSLAMTVAQRDLQEYLQAHMILILPAEIAQLKHLQSIVDLKKLSLLAAKLDLFLAQQQHRQNEDFRQFDQLMPMQSLYTVTGEIGKITGDLMILQASWKQLVNELGGEQYVADAVGEHAKRVHNIRKNVQFLLKKRKLLASEYHTMLQSSYQQLYKYLYDEQRQYRRRLQTGQSPASGSKRNAAGGFTKRNGILLPNPEMGLNPNKPSPHSGNNSPLVKARRNNFSLEDESLDEDDANTINTVEIGEQGEFTPNEKNIIPVGNSAESSLVKSSAVSGEGSSLVEDSVTIDEDLDTSYHRLWDHPSSLEEQFENAENEECCKRDYEAEFRRRRQLQHVSLSTSIFPQWTPFIIVADAELPKKFLSTMIQTLCASRNCISFLCVDYAQEQRLLEERILSLEEDEETDYSSLGYYNVSEHVYAELYSEDFYLRLLNEPDFDPVAFAKRRNKSDVLIERTRIAINSSWERFSHHVRRRSRIQELSQTKLLRSLQVIIQAQNKHILLLVHRHAHGRGITKRESENFRKNALHQLNSQRKHTGSSGRSNDNTMHSVSCLELTDEHLQTVFKVLLPAPRIVLVSAAQCFTANPTEENNLAHYLKRVMMQNVNQTLSNSVFTMRKVTHNTSSCDDEKNTTFDGALGRLRSISARLGHSLLLCHSAIGNRSQTSAKDDDKYPNCQENLSFFTDWEFFLKRVMFLAKSIEIFQKRHRHWPTARSTTQALDQDDALESASVADDVTASKSIPITGKNNSQLKQPPVNKAALPSAEFPTVTVLRRLLERFYSQSSLYPQTWPSKQLREVVETDMMVLLIALNMNLLLHWAPGCFSGSWDEVEVLNMLLTFRQKLTTVSLQHFAQRLFTTERFLFKSRHRSSQDPKAVSQNCNSDSELSDHSESCTHNEEYILTETPSDSNEITDAFAHSNALWIKELYYHNVRTFSRDLVLPLMHLEFFLQHDHCHILSSSSGSDSSSNRKHTHGHPAFNMFGQWISSVFNWAHSSVEHFANSTSTFSSLSIPAPTSTDKKLMSSETPSISQQRKSLTMDFFQYKYEPNTQEMARLLQRPPRLQHRLHQLLHVLLKPFAVLQLDSRIIEQWYKFNEQETKRKEEERKKKQAEEALLDESVDNFCEIIMDPNEQSIVGDTSDVDFVAAVTVSEQENPPLETETSSVTEVSKKRKSSKKLSKLSKKGSNKNLATTSDSEVEQKDHDETNGNMSARRRSSKRSSSRPSSASAAEAKPVVTFVEVKEFVPPPPPLKNPFLLPRRVPHTLNFQIATQGRWKLFFDKDCLDSLTTQALGSLAFSFIPQNEDNVSGENKAQDKQVQGNVDVVSFERTTVTVYHQGEDIYIELCVTLPCEPESQLEVWERRSKHLGKVNKNPAWADDSDNEESGDTHPGGKHNVDDTLRATVSQVLQNVGILYTNDEHMEETLSNTVNESAEEFFSSIHDYSIGLDEDDDVADCNYSSATSSLPNCDSRKVTQCRFISHLSQEDFVQLLQPNYTEIFEGKVKKLAKANNQDDIQGKDTPTAANADDDLHVLSKNEIEQLLEATYQRQKTNRDFYEMLMGWIVVDLVSDVSSEEKSEQTMASAKNDLNVSKNEPKKNEDAAQVAANAIVAADSAQNALQLVPSADSSSKRKLNDNKPFTLINPNLKPRNPVLYSADSLSRFNTAIIRSRFLVLSKLGEVSGYFSRLEIYEERFAELRILIFVNKCDLYPHLKQLQTSGEAFDRLEMLKSHYKLNAMRKQKSSGQSPQGRLDFLSASKSETHALQLLVDRAAVYSLSASADPLIEAQKLETFDTAALSYIFSNRLQITPSKAWLYFVNPPTLGRTPHGHSHYFDYFSSSFSHHRGKKRSTEDSEKSISARLIKSNTYSDLLLPTALITQPIITIRRKGGAGRLVGRVLINILDLFYAPVYSQRNESESPFLRSAQSINGVTWLSEDEYVRLLEVNSGESSDKEQCDKRGFVVVMTIFEVQSELPAHELRVVFYHLQTQQHMEIRLSALERVLLFADLRFIQQQRRIQENVKKAEANRPAGGDKAEAEESESEDDEEEDNQYELEALEKGDARNFLIPDNDVNIEEDENSDDDDDNAEKKATQSNHSGNFVKQLIGRLRLVYTAAMHPVQMQNRTFLHLPECKNLLDFTKDPENVNASSDGKGDYMNEEANRLSMICQKQENVLVYSPQSLLLHKLKTPKYYKVDGHEEYHLVFPNDEVQNYSKQLKAKDTSTNRKMSTGAHPSSASLILQKMPSRNVLLNTTRGGRPPVQASADLDDDDDIDSVGGKRINSEYPSRPATTSGGIAFIDNSTMTYSSAEFPDELLSSTPASFYYGWALVFDRAPVAALRGNVLITITLHSTQQQAFHISVYDPLSHREEFALLPFAHAIKYLELPDMYLTGKSNSEGGMKASSSANLESSLKDHSSGHKQLFVKGSFRQKKREKYQEKLRRKKLREERNARTKDNLEQLLGNIDESVVLMLCEQLLPFVEIIDSDEDGLQLKLLPPYYDEDIDASDDEEDDSSDSENEDNTKEDNIMKSLLKEQQELQAKQRLKRDLGAKLEKEGLVLAQLFLRQPNHSNIVESGLNMEISSKFGSKSVVGKQKQKSKAAQQNSSLRITVTIRDIQQLSKPAVWQQMIGGRNPVVKVVYNDELVAQVALFNYHKRYRDDGHSSIQIDRKVDVYLSRMALLNVSSLQFLVYDYEYNKGEDMIFLGNVLLQGSELVDYVSQSFEGSLPVTLPLEPLSPVPVRHLNDEAFNKYVAGQLSLIFHSEQIVVEDAVGRGGFHSVSLPSANENTNNNTEPGISRNRRNNIPNKFGAASKPGMNASAKSRKGKFASGKFGGGSQISVRRSVAFSQSISADQSAIAQALEIARRAAGSSMDLEDEHDDDPSVVKENNSVFQSEQEKKSPEAPILNESTRNDDATVESIRDTFFALNIARVSISVPLETALRIYGMYFAHTTINIPASADYAQPAPSIDVHDTDSIQHQVRDFEEVRVAARIVVDDCEICTSPATQLLPLFDPYLEQVFAQRRSDEGNSASAENTNVDEQSGDESEHSPSLERKSMYTLHCAIDTLALPCHLCRDMPLALTRVRLSLIFTIPSQYIVNESTIGSHGNKQETDNRVCVVQVCNINEDILGVHLHEQLLRHPLNQHYYSQDAHEGSNNLHPIRPNAEDEVLRHCLSRSFLPIASPDIPLNHLAHPFSLVHTDAVSLNLLIGSGSVAVYATLHPARAVSLVPICLQHVLLPKHAEVHFAQFLKQQNALDSTQHPSADPTSGQQVVGTYSSPMSSAEELSPLVLPISLHFNHVHYGEHSLSIKFKVAMPTMDGVVPGDPENNQNMAPISEEKQNEEIPLHKYSSIIGLANRRFMKQASTPQGKPPNAAAVEQIEQVQHGKVVLLRIPWHFTWEQCALKCSVPLPPHYRSKNHHYSVHSIDSHDDRYINFTLNGDQIKNLVFYSVSASSLADTSLAFELEEKKAFWQRYGHSYSPVSQTLQFQHTLEASLPIGHNSVEETESSTLDLRLHCGPLLARLQNLLPPTTTGTNFASLSKFMGGNKSKNLEQDHLVTAFYNNVFPSSVFPIRLPSLLEDGSKLSTQQNGDQYFHNPFVLAHKLLVQAKELLPALQRFHSSYEQANHVYFQIHFDGFSPKLPEELLFHIDVIFNTDYIGFWEYSSGDNVRRARGLQRSCGFFLQMPQSLGTKSAITLLRESTLTLSARTIPHSSGRYTPPNKNKKAVMESDGGDANVNQHKNFLEEDTENNDDAASEQRATLVISGNMLHWLWRTQQPQTFTWQMPASNVEEVKPKDALNEEVGGDPLIEGAPTVQQRRRKAAAASKARPLESVLRLTSGKHPLHSAVQSSASGEDAVDKNGQPNLLSNLSTADRMGDDIGWMKRSSEDTIPVEIPISTDTNAISASSKILEMDMDRIEVDRFVLHCTRILLTPAVSPSMPTHEGANASEINSLSVEHLKLTEYVEEKLQVFQELRRVRAHKISSMLKQVLSLQQQQEQSTDMPTAAPNTTGLSNLFHNPEDKLVFPFAAHFINLRLLVYVNGRCVGHVRIRWNRDFYSHKRKAKNFQALFQGTSTNDEVDLTEEFSFATFGAPAAQCPALPALLKQHQQKQPQDENGMPNLDYQAFHLRFAVVFCAIDNIDEHETLFRLPAVARLTQHNMIESIFAQYNRERLLYVLGGHVPAESAHLNLAGGYYAAERHNHHANENAPKEHAHVSVEHLLARHSNLLKLSERRRLENALCSSLERGFSTYGIVLGEKYLHSRHLRSMMQPYHDHLQDQLQQQIRIQTTASLAASTNAAAIRRLSLSNVMQRFATKAAATSSGKKKRHFVHVTQQVEFQPPCYLIPAPRPKQFPHYPLSSSASSWTNEKLVQSVLLTRSNQDASGTKSKGQDGSVVNAAKEGKTVGGFGFLGNFSKMVATATGKANDQDGQVLQEELDAAKLSEIESQDYETTLTLWYMDVTHLSKIHYLQAMTTRDIASGAGGKIFQLTALLVPQFSCFQDQAALMSDKYLFHRNLALKWLSESRNRYRHRQQSEAVVYISPLLPDVTSIKQVRNKSEDFGVDALVSEDEEDGTDAERSDQEEDLRPVHRLNHGQSGSNRQSSMSNRRLLNAGSDNSPKGGRSILNTSGRVGSQQTLTGSQRKLSSLNHTNSSNNVSFGSILDNATANHKSSHSIVNVTNSVPPASSVSMTIILNQQRRKLEPAAVSYSVTLSAADSSNITSGVDSRPALRDSVTPKLLDSSSDSDSEASDGVEEAQQGHHGNFASNFFQHSSSIFRQQDKQRHKKQKEKLKRLRRQRRRQMIFASRSSQLVRSHSLRGLTVNSDVVYLEEALDAEGDNGTKSFVEQNNDNLVVTLPVTVSELVTSSQISHFPIVQVQQLLGQNQEDFTSSTNPLDNSVEDVDAKATSPSKMMQAAEEAAAAVSNENEFFLAGLSRRFQIQVLSRAGVSLGSSVVMAEKFNCLDYRHPYFQRSCILLSKIFAQADMERRLQRKNQKKYTSFNIMEKNVSLYSQLAMAVIASEERLLHDSTGRRVLVDENDIMIMRLLGLKPPKQLLKSLKNQLQNARLLAPDTAVEIPNLSLHELSSDSEPEVEKDDDGDGDAQYLPKQALAEEDRWRRLAPFLLHVPSDAIFSTMIPTTLQPFVKHLTQIMHSISAKSSKPRQMRPNMSRNQEEDDLLGTEEDLLYQRMYNEYQVPRPKLIIWNWPVVFHHLISHRLTIDLKLWEKMQAMGKSLAAQNLNKSQSQRQLPSPKKNSKQGKKKTKKTAALNQSVVSLLSFDGKYTYDSDEDIDYQDMEDEDADHEPQISADSDASRRESYSSAMDTDGSSIGKARLQGQRSTILTFQSAAGHVSLSTLVQQLVQQQQQYDAERSAQSLGVQLRIFSGNVRITGLSFRTLIFLTPRSPSHDAPPVKGALPNNQTVNEGEEQNKDISDENGTQTQVNHISSTTMLAISSQDERNLQRAASPGPADLPEESILLYESEGQSHGVTTRPRSNTMMSGITIHSQQQPPPPQSMEQLRSASEDLQSAALANIKSRGGGSSSVYNTFDEEFQKLYTMFELDANFLTKYGEQIAWKLLAENPDTFFYLLSQYHQDLHHHHHQQHQSQPNNSGSSVEWKSDLFALDELTIVYQCRINPQSLTSSASITPAQRLRLLTERKNYEVRVPGWLVRRYYLSFELFPYHDLSTKYRRTALGKLLVSLLAVSFEYTSELLRMTVLLPREITTIWKGAEDAFQRLQAMRTQLRQQQKRFSRSSHRPSGIGSTQHRQCINSNVSGANRAVRKSIHSTSSFSQTRNSAEHRPSLINVRKHATYTANFPNEERNDNGSNHI